MNVLRSSDDSEIVDQFAMANSFTDYFSLVFQGDDNNFCRLPLCTSLFLDSVAVGISRILSAIGKLSDDFPKRPALAICVPLSYVFGFSLSGAWKIAIVVPLPMK